MATVTKSTTIAAPPSEVWAVLADFDAISAWAPNVDHSCLLSTQTEGIGMVRRIQTGRATVVETVKIYEPGSTIGYSIAGLPSVIDSVTNTWTVEESGGATEVTLTTEIDAGVRPPQKAVARGLGRVLGKVSDQMLGGLAAHFEGNDA